MQSKRSSSGEGVEWRGRAEGRRIIILMQLEETHPYLMGDFEWFV
jgi:hypothetical protein